MYRTLTPTINDSQIHHLTLRRTQIEAEKRGQSQRSLVALHTSFNGFMQKVPTESSLQGNKIINVPHAAAAADGQNSKTPQ